MPASPIFDIAGPGVLLFAGGVFFTVFTFGTLGLETLVLWLLKWASFGRSLLAVFLMNLVTTVLGFILFLGWTLLGADYFSIFIVGFPLSVLVEGGVLMLMKKDAARQNWIASFFANVASYAFLAFALLFFNLL